MARTKLKFRLHRAVIVLFCLALLVALMQGASWFSQNHQRQRNPQLEELARTLARQVTLNVAPLMRTDSPDEKRIQARKPLSGAAPGGAEAGPEDEAAAARSLARRLCTSMTVE